MLTKGSVQMQKGHGSSMLSSGSVRMNKEISIPRTVIKTIPISGSVTMMLFG